jgi:hypothetical protein
MEEKVRILGLILIILITAAILSSALIYIRKEMIYLNAYSECIKSGTAIIQSTPDWFCFNALQQGVYLPTSRQSNEPNKVLPWGSE